MTTSITDARYTSLHFTPGALLSLSIDDPPETGWSVMPGYDEHIEIPLEQEPPRMDADETLPNLLHPSYPYGRPPTLNTTLGRGMGARGGKSLLGTVGVGGGAGNGGGRGGWGGGIGGGEGENGGSGSRWMGGRWAGEDGWGELGMGGFVERMVRKEVPPGMAGAKRPPSPPSPALRPAQVPQPRSEHLRNLYARQRQADPTPTADQFDAPVPNELYAEEGGHEQGNESAMTNTAVPEAVDDRHTSFSSDAARDDERSVD